MKINNRDLIEDLIQRTKDVMNAAIELESLNNEILNWRSSEKSWSVLECFEHLNRYGDFYLSEIEKSINEGKKVEENEIFKSGWLGNYFANSMLPKEKLNKMNTFKSMNPLGSALDKSTLEKFINQQKQMLQLLGKARTVDLSKTKTAISISNWIKLRLGDTFRVVIYHNQRHVVQARKVLAQQKSLVMS
ncbi:MAG: DinB family protein [Bacteroidota bacterium]